MSDKKSALPGLPPPEDEVLEFASSAVAGGQESDSELDDEYAAHTVSDDEDDSKTSRLLRPMDSR